MQGGPLWLSYVEKTEQDKHKAPASAPPFPLSLHSMGAIRSQNLPLQNFPRPYEVGHLCLTPDLWQNRETRTI
jgi:hypothetical protein